VLWRSGIRQSLRDDEQLAGVEQRRRRQRVGGGNGGSIHPKANGDYRQGIAGLRVIQERGKRRGRGRGGRGRELGKRGGGERNGRGAGELGGRRGRGFRGLKERGGGSRRELRVGGGNLLQRARKADQRENQPNQPKTSTVR
jgi:hypothetical protein